MSTLSMTSAASVTLESCGNPFHPALRMDMTPEAPVSDSETPKFKVGDKVRAKTLTPYGITTNGWEGYVIRLTPFGMEVEASMSFAHGYHVEPKYFDLIDDSKGKTFDELFEGLVEGKVLRCVEEHEPGVFFTEGKLYPIYSTGGMLTIDDDEGIDVPGSTWSPALFVMEDKPLTLGCTPAEPPSEGVGFASLPHPLAEGTKVKCVATFNWHRHIAGKIYTVDATGSFMDEGSDRNPLVPFPRLTPTDWDGPHRAQFIIVDDVETTPVVDDEPTVWMNLSDEEKATLLLSDHEGKIIEFYAGSWGTWHETEHPEWVAGTAYRVKPELSAEEKRKLAVAEEIESLREKISTFEATIH